MLRQVLNFQQSKYILQDPTIPVSINPNANLQASLILQLHFWLCLSFQSMHLRITVCNLEIVSSPPIQFPPVSQLMIAGRISTFLQNQPAGVIAPSPSLPLNLKLSKYLRDRCPGIAGMDPSCLRGRAPPTPISLGC